MELGIVSDTHDNYSAAEEIAEIFADRDVETLVHCGDFIAPPLLAAFEGHDFTIHGVLGNNDGERDGLETTIDSFSEDSRLHGRFADLAFDGTRIHVLHGDQGRQEVDARAETGEYDVVCYGHFHQTDEREVEGTLVVNPGAHFPTVPPEHRSVAVLDTDGPDVEFLSIEG